MKKWLPHEDAYILDNMTKSSKEIADYLGRSRSSVTSRLHRLGMSKNVIRKTKKELKIPLIKKTNGRIPLLHIQNGQCRYSQDTGADMMCCGKPTHKNYNYCRECCDIVFRDGWENIKPIKPRPEWREGIFY